MADPVTPAAPATPPAAAPAPAAVVEPTAPVVEPVAAVVEPAAPVVDPAAPVNLLDDDGAAPTGEVDLALYVYTPPEGVELTEDQTTGLAEFQTAAQAMGLTPEQYQTIVELDRNRTLDSQAQFDALPDAWAEQTRVDPLLGGDNLAETTGYAKAAMQHLNRDGLNAILGRRTEANPGGLGLGNHPEIVGVLAALGRAVSEGKLIEGAGVNDAQASDAGLRRMYPTMFNTA